VKNIFSSDEKYFLNRPARKNAVVFSSAYTAVEMMMKFFLKIVERKSGKNIFKV
jgi:hypothetical protein